MFLKIFAVVCFKIAKTKHIVIISVLTLVQQWRKQDTCACWFLWHWVFTLLTTWEPAAFFLTHPSQCLMNTHTHYWTAQSKNNEMLKNAAFVTGAHTACPTGFSPKSFNWIFLSVRGRRCSFHPNIPEQTLASAVCVCQYIMTMNILKAKWSCVSAVTLRRNHCSELIHMHFI